MYILQGSNIYKYQAIGSWLFLALGLRSFAEIIQKRHQRAPLEIGTYASMHISATLCRNPYYPWTLDIFLFHGPMLTRQTRQTDGCWPSSLHPPPPPSCLHIYYSSTVPTYIHTYITLKNITNENQGRTSPIRWFCWWCPCRHKLVNIKQDLCFMIR